jgi:predicted nucleic-acid-binding protein
VTGLDTNVLLGWLLNRRSKLPGGGPFRISLIVLVELVWVLQSQFRNSRSEIASIIETLLQIPDVDVAGRDAVKAALDDFRDGGADFADYLIGHDNALSGCETTWTYDRKAGRNPRFTLLQMEN